jgi:hypothetical protein
MGALGRPQEMSGTPQETRGAASNAGNMFGQMFRGGNFDSIMANLGGSMSRNATAAQMAMLGFDPSILNLGGVAQDLLVDPADATSGLFAAMQPFEARTMAENVAGIRGSLGSLGGRFSRNLVEGEGQLRGEIANQFAKTREESLLAANAQRSNNYGMINQLLQSAANSGNANTLQALQTILGYIQPGAPAYGPSPLSQLINLGTLGATLYRGGTPGTGTATAPTVPVRSQGVPSNLLFGGMR